jgi:hypothetical protein
MWRRGESYVVSSWVLVPALVSLRNEFNVLAPGRDRASDGSIGDAAHRAEGPSGHNPDDTPGSTPENSDADAIPEVRAIDVDADLRQPGWSMERAVQIIVDRHRSGVDTRLDYVIYNRRIWARAYGWEEREYVGVNPHDKHAHFSCRAGSGTAGNPEAFTGPWGLLADEDEGMDAAEFMASVARAVRNKADDPASAGDRANRTNFAVGVRFALGYNWNVQDGDDTVPDEKTVMGKLDEILSHVE